MRRVHVIRAASAAVLTLLGTGPAGAAATAPAADVTSDDDAALRTFDDTLAFFRHRSAREYAIDPARGVDEASFVRLGGIDQWVRIRGRDRANPVLLFVHGGPGDVTSPWSLPYFFAWERHFTVVQWDQRGAGKTFGRSGPAVAATMTVDRMAADGIELVQYLRDHLRVARVVLVAHSFGTLLGLRMIRQRPEYFAAYVGTGQVADEVENYAAAYRALLRAARDAGVPDAIADLERIGPPPYASSDGYQVQRLWSNRFEGADRFLPGTIGIALQSPDYSVRDLNDTLAGEVFSADQLVPHIRSARMHDLGLEFAVPMYFFQGTDDFSTPTELARTYLDALKAPVKAFVPIPGGHFAVFINTDRFLAELVARVRPTSV